jgi:hypothetical protein
VLSNGQLQAGTGGAAARVAGAREITAKLAKHMRASRLASHLMSPSPGVW